MATGIYTFLKGKKVELSAKQVKADIMKIYGISTAEYNKLYDITRNQLRAYERVTGAESKQSVSQFLFTEAKAKARYGVNYRPSAHVEAVRSTSSISTGKALEKAVKSKQSAFYKRQQKIAEKGIDRFDALIKTSPKAREIDEAIKDPIKKLEALKAFAKEMHAQIDSEGKAAAMYAIPFYSSAGSPDAAEDFDYSAWLDDE